jgi:hypothetical protein
VGLKALPPSARIKGGDYDFGEKPVYLAARPSQASFGVSERRTRAAFAGPAMRPRWRKKGERVEIRRPKGRMAQRQAW